MKIAVAGGSGVVGRHVIAAATRRGHEAVAVARSTGADVLTGAGLDEALAGADAVIDVTNCPTTLSAKVATRFFETGTANLLSAERRVGVPHHVVLSIVGIDGIDVSYYAGKLAQERAVAAGPIDHTVVRAAQFHEFAGQLLGAGGPVAFLPTLLMRPVAAREVGEYLVAAAEQGPSGRVTDLVGPRDERLADVARRQLAHDGLRRRVLEIRLPGAYGKGLASGALRGAEPRREGTMTFDAWLDSGTAARIVA